MNKERYQEIIDEAYKNYWSNAKHNNSDCLIKQEEGSLLVEMRFYYKQEFINKCKTDNEFSEKWGLKIEERELTLKERNDYYTSNYLGLDCESHEELNKLGDIPTKLITLTYNNEKTEIYE